MGHSVYIYVCRCVRACVSVYVWRECRLLEVERRTGQIS